MSMGVLIHMLEIAALLAVAYSIGWLLGYLAHRLAARPVATTTAIPAERMAAATGTADALVKAPDIAPVIDPAVPEPAPVIAPAEVVATEPQSIESPAPAETVTPTPSVETISTTPSASVPEPKLVEIAAELAAMPEIPLPPVAPTPETSEPTPAPQAVQAVEVQVAPAAPPADDASSPAAPAPHPPEATEATEKRLSRFARFRPKPQPEPAPQAQPPVVEPVITAMPAARSGEAWSGEMRGRSASAPYHKAVPEAPISEDDAMRAIEGGWSRVKARAMPAAPELADLGVAVAAAQVAVEQVLARSGVEAAPPDHKPRGLLRPRAGVKDDLRRIAGLGELDESTLNNLGVYHYDQIAGWTAADVTWMERHAFAPGRIAREDWQGQARALHTAA